MELYTILSSTSHAQGVQSSVVRISDTELNVVISLPSDFPCNPRHAGIRATGTPLVFYGVGLPEHLRDVLHPFAAHINVVYSHIGDWTDAPDVIATAEHLGDLWAQVDNPVTRFVRWLPEWLRAFSGPAWSWVTLLLVMAFLFDIHTTDNPGLKAGGLAGIVGLLGLYVLGALKARDQ
jgi:hypothetical protein